MLLFLDPTTRVLKSVAPDGAQIFADDVFAGFLKMSVSDASWTSTYQPAWLTARAAGQDLVVAGDGSTTQIVHVATLREQAYSTLSTYLANLTPTGADTVLALKTLIRVVRTLV